MLRGHDFFVAVRTRDDHVVRNARVILKRAATIKGSGVALMTSEAPMGLLMSSHQPRGWKDGLARPACEPVSYTHLTLPTNREV